MGDGSSAKTVKEKLAIFCILYHGKMAIEKNGKSIIMKIEIRTRS